MSRLEIVLLVMTCVAAVSAITAVLVSRKKTEYLLRHIDDMLTDAMDGRFCERNFDESLLSSVETKLSHYLSASEVSSQNLREEKDKIKELISDISHQTKTPIANILLYAQLLCEQSLPEAGTSCVTALHEQAEKLSFLIGALIKTSRLETGILVLHPQQNCVQTMLDAVYEQTVRKAEEKEIVITLHKTTAVACFDSRWTTEAVYNIVDNAVKYTLRGGTVEIITTGYDLFCRIDIIDSGMGIAEEEQAKIFGRFYRSATAYDTEGIGIGLYLSRQIISGEGGYIKVQSAPYTGTTFSVFLPCEG